MNIIQIISTPFNALGSGGASRVAYDISKYLSGKGENVTLITTDLKDSKIISNINDKNKEDNINILRFSLDNHYLAWKYKLYISFKMHKYLKNNIRYFDIVHLHDLISLQAIITRKYCIKFKIPYIITTHGSVNWLNEKKLINIFYRKYGLKILKDAKYISVFTKDEKEQCNIIGISNNKLKLLPNGFDFNNIFYKQEKNLFRKKYSIDNSTKIILFIGRLEKTKGINLLINSFYVLSKKYNNTKLVIAGPDDGFIKDIKVLINKYKIKDKVIITGLLDEQTKYQAYIDANVHVSPRKWEPFGLTLLESMACGTPVICCNECGISSYINNRTGLSVNYEESEMINAMELILFNEEKNTIFKNNSYLLVKEEFNWDIIINNLINVYQEMIDKNNIIKSF